MADGAVTHGNQTNRDRLISVLNDVLATEIMCTLRYKHHYLAASGIHSESVAKEFLEHAQEEQQHADWVAKRIAQLGGTPDMEPTRVSARSYSEYGDAASLPEMLREDLVAERVAIEMYTDVVRWIGDDDPTTRRLMEEILAKEEEHADDLAHLLTTMR